MTAEQAVIEALKLDIVALKRHANELLHEKNLVARQLEILCERFSLTDSDREQLRREANPNERGQP